MGSVDIPATHKSERSGSLSTPTMEGLQKRRDSAASAYRPTSSRASSRGSVVSLGSGILTRPEVEIAFVEPLDMKHECPVCGQVLRYPVQFEDCGHRCCSSCLPELLRVAPRCPIDQIFVEREKVYVDKAFQKEIDKLAVKCSHHTRGCKWQSTLVELIDHLDGCNYVLVQCPNKCNVEFERRFLSRHLKSDCPNLERKCDFCETPFQQKEEMQHLQECGRFPLPCPNGCKKKQIPREELQAHMEHDCQKEVIPCPFSEAGCQFKCVRKEMINHVREKPEDHLCYIGDAMLTFKRIMNEQQDTLEEHKTRLGEVEKRVESLAKLYGSQLVWKIDDYAQKLKDAKSGTKTTIYSPPFLTSRHGYKMALSLCLYGDGKSRGRYMSLFVCICRGDYDALLLWPFGHRVTFTLIDQCQDPDARRNVTYTVKPNICKENKPFLGRPLGDRNASFGAQKFVDLELVNTLDYTRDDTMYIKVHIDTDDMILL